MPSLRWFPFDQHECELQVGTWSLENTIFNPVLREISHESNTTKPRTKRRIVILYPGAFKRNSQWDIISIEDNIKNYNMLPGKTVPIFTSTLTLRRNAPLLAVALLCPMLASAVLGLASFLLPPTHSSRLSLPLTANLLVSCALHYMHVLVGSGRGNTPIIADFSATCHVLLMASCIQSMLALYLNKRKSAPPDIIVNMIRCLPNQLLNLWGLEVENSDLFGGNDENALLEESDTAPNVMSWQNAVVVLDGLSFTVQSVIVLVITCASIVTE